MARMVMLFDASKCTACRGCQIACKQWNDLPASRTVQTGTYENPLDLQHNTYTRILFNEYEGPDRFQWLFLKWGCLHCGQAACADVCPTAALKYHETGTITVEQDLCNGCGYCAEACPFDIPRLESNTLTGYGKVNKCNFCQDRISNDQIPACIKTCPPGVLAWGTREEMLDKAKYRVEWLKARGYPEANLYGENEVGGLGRVFVLTAPPPAYGLPEDPQYPAAARLAEGQPLLHGCEPVLDQTLALDDSLWLRPICPLCGGEPDMASLDRRGVRRLLCARCDTEWAYRRVGCPFCGSEAPNDLSYYPDQSGAYRLYTCDGCGRYLKTVDLRRAPHPYVYLSNGC